MPVQDRKSLAAAYLLQSELALLKKENRLGLKAAMRSRDLSRKTGTKKGEAGGQKSLETKRVTHVPQERKSRCPCHPCQASALLQLCSAYCARGELKRGCREWM